MKRTNAKNRICEEKGAAMAWILVLFVVLAIITTSIIVISRQDILETKNQKERLEAYYLALSGIEIGYAALMNSDSSPGPQYIDRFNASKADVSYSHTIVDSGNTIGTVDITIGNVTVDGKRWIQIAAVGKLSGSNMNQTSGMLIDPENHLNILRNTMVY